MASTKDVIDHHLKCFGEGDLKGILSDYAPDAVLFTSDGPLRGVDAIKPLFEAMVAEFAKPGATFSMKQQFVEGDYAYILWTAETADNVYEVGTDTFVVRDDKIVAQSFTGKITPKGWKPGESQPPTPSGFAEIVSDYFPVLHQRDFLPSLGPRIKKNPAWNTANTNSGIRTSLIAGSPTYQPRAVIFCLYFILLFSPIPELRT
jgi:hypothetical protein